MDLPTPVFPGAQSSQPAEAPVNEDREILTTYLRDFASELGDRASLKTSTTRALHLYQQSGLRRELFLQRLYEARAITKDRTASIRGGTTKTTASKAGKNKMPFFFAVLEDLLGLRPKNEATLLEGHPAENDRAEGQEPTKSGADRTHPIK